MECEEVAESIFSLFVGRENKAGPPSARANAGKVPLKHGTSILDAVSYRIRALRHHGPRYEERVPFGKCFD